MTRLDGRLRCLERAKRTATHRRCVICQDWSTVYLTYADDPLRVEGAPAAECSGCGYRPIAICIRYVDAAEYRRLGKSL
jgi:hypothetical protein